MFGKSSSQKCHERQNKYESGDIHEQIKQSTYKAGWKYGREDQRVGGGAARKHGSESSSEKHLTLPSRCITC